MAGKYHESAQGEYNLNECLGARDIIFDSVIKADIC